mmetsp:Transcript_31429/g.73715  ORF Transcript_31429/g.73715 Transcript_31429/m.73715 type:complete len:81 (+) Transcript_31429:12-254(+)
MAPVWIDSLQVSGGGGRWDFQTIPMMSTYSVMGIREQPITINTQSSTKASPTILRCSIAGKMIARGMLQKLPSIEMKMGK